MSPAATPPPASLRSSHLPLGGRAMRDRPAAERWGCDKDIWTGAIAPQSSNFSQIFMPTECQNYQYGSVNGSTHLMNLYGCVCLKNTNMAASAWGKKFSGKWPWGNPGPSAVHSKVIRRNQRLMRGPHGETFPQQISFCGGSTHILVLAHSPWLGHNHNRRREKSLNHFF